MLQRRGWYDQSNIIKNENESNFSSIEFLWKRKNTLQYAIDFAEHVSATVYVIKVYSPNKVSGSIKTVRSLLEENSKKELKELVLSADRKNVEVVTSSLPGALIDNIQLFEQKINIDLIISPSNRISSYETRCIGKITGSIINNVDCPIFCSAWRLCI